MPTTKIPVKEFAAKALADEFGRRRKNKGRAQGDKKRAKAWQLSKLSTADRLVLEAGGTVTVEGTNAGKVNVRLLKAKG